MTSDYHPKNEMGAKEDMEKYVSCERIMEQADQVTFMGFRAVERKKHFMDLVSAILEACQKVDAVKVVHGRLGLQYNDDTMDSSQIAKYVGLITFSHAITADCAEQRWMEWMTMKKCCDCFHYNACKGFIGVGIDDELLIGASAEGCEDFISSADIVPAVHGRWIYEPVEFSLVKDIRCSVCRRYVQVPENYCPNCGAKIDLEEQNGKS